MQFRVPTESPKPQPFSFPDYMGGMNISTTADQIKINETPDVLNMQLESGVWEKRTGFEQFKTMGSAPIRGMYLFEVNENESKILVFQNGMLFEMEG